MLDLPTPESPRSTSLYEKSACLPLIWILYYGFIYNNRYQLLSNNIRYLSPLNRYYICLYN